MLDRYGCMDLGSMDLSIIMKDMMEIMKAHHIGMPGGLSMLVRGLATMEGVVVDIAPSINVTQVATARISRTFLRDFDWKSALSRDAHAVYESAYKALDIPALISDALKTALRGEGVLGVEHQFGDQAAELVRENVKKICAAIISAALILSACLGTDTALETVVPSIWIRIILSFFALLLTLWILLPAKRK
jgi:ubiquinone biosynthesis protein